MQLKPCKTSNGHTVTIYGRLFFQVSSASRKNLIHLVDLEGFEHWRTVCTCEAWKYGTRPCRHIAACLEAIARWAGIPDYALEMFTDRLMFLLQMNMPFVEAIHACAEAFKPKPKNTLQYKLDKTKKIKR